MVHPGPFFEVADGELGHGVLEVESVEVCGLPLEVAQEGVVAPGRATGRPGRSVKRVRRTISRRPL